MCIPCWTAESLPLARSPCAPCPARHNTGSLRSPPVRVHRVVPAAGIPLRPVSARISFSAHTASHCCSCPGIPAHPPDGGKSALLCAAAFSAASGPPPSTRLCWGCTSPDSGSSPPPGSAAAPRSSFPGRRISVPSGSCGLSSGIFPVNLGLHFRTNL